jgi:general secretion pathway protein L
MKMPIVTKSPEPVTTLYRPGKSIDRTMIGRFLSWWLGQLSALLPFSTGEDAGQWLDVTLDKQRVRAVLRDRRERVLMDVARTQKEALQAQLRAIAERLDWARTRCRIWVDAGEVLGREIELPIAAEENLREVLSFEMARKTPFRAQDVHFDALLTTRNPARRSLGLYLSVVPRRALDDVLSAFEDWSLEAIPAAGAAGIAQSNKQAVFAFQSASFAKRSHTGLNVTLGALVLVLAGVCVWLPLNAQQHIRLQLEAQLRQAQTEATEAMALRDEFEAVQRARNYLSVAQTARPAMVQVIEALTTALPDNTFLSRLQIGDGEVNLHGSSQAASELIAILERLPLLYRVRFASPVTRDAPSGGERFHIVAYLAAGKAAAPSGEAS